MDGLNLQPHPAAAQRIAENNRKFPGVEFTPQDVIDVQSVRVGNRILAYCGYEPGRPVTFITPVPDAVARAVREFVAKEVGEPGRVAQPPELVVDPRREQAEADEDEDEDVEYVDEPTRAE